MAQSGKTNLNFQIVQEVPSLIIITIGQNPIINKQRNKLENSNWFNTNSIFETKLKLFPKIQNKIMGSFIIILGASMNISIIFGNVELLQIIEFWKISKMPLFKPCEQRLAKTF